MKKLFCFLFNNAINIIFIALFLLSISLIFFKFSLVADGVFMFINTLKNFVWGDSRSFVTFLLNFPTIFFIVCKIYSFKIIFGIQSFWYLFINIACLYVIYLLLDKKNKNYILLPLISNLLCLIFSGTFLASESLLTANLYWIVLYYFSFIDFQKINIKILPIIYIALFFLIKSYEMMAILSIFLIIPFIIRKKEFIILNIKDKLLICSFILFVIIIFIFHVYWLYDSTSTYRYSYPIREFFCNKYILLILISLILFYLCVLFAFFCKTKYIIFFQITIFLILTIIFFKYNFLFGLGVYRFLNFIITFIFSILFIFIFFWKIKINILILKNIALFLVFILVFNFTSFNLKWNKTINDFCLYIENSNSNIIYVSQFKKNFNWIFDNEHFLPWLSLIVQNIFGNRKIYNIICIDNDNWANDWRLFNISKKIKWLPKLQKFGIIYSNDLLQQIENKERKEKNVQDFNDL